ncbi:hypothetical protein MJ749_14975 [Paenibacillus polymyxa]|uniref:hypothetical protein n=1 Tax=Paenibacillus polymyxa TaxID=1406 RepID=UPI001F0FDC8A|nr:hypothetical protein [Paenibacillus polymyxa]UMR33998.1 hypothetical protein MJ749_14975 [Paenibacillus polymyxa]
MAKLNVTVPAVDVEVNGVKYRKVDRDAQVGDIIRYEGDSSWVTNGAFYAITRLVGADDPQIVDNDGDEYDLCGEEFEVYAKVSGTAEYREVKRWAKPGERIRIVNKYYNENRYKNGDEFVVDSADGDGDVRITVGTSDDVMVMLSEYEVLESVTTEKSAPKRLTVGDYAKVIANSTSHNYTIGSFVKIVRDDEDHQPYRAEKADGTEGNFLAEKDVEPATEAEFLAQKRLKVGDHVKVTRDNGCTHPGMVYVIAETDSTSIPYRLAKLNGEIAGWKVACDVVRATDEEVAQAKRKLAAETTTDPRSQFAKGEKVRLINGGGKYPLNGYANGEIYEVDTPLYDTHRSGPVIKIVGGVIPHGYAKPEQLAKLTIEVGSTVRLTIKDGEKPVYGWGRVNNGAIGTVTNIDGTSAYVNFPEQRWWHALLSELTLVTDGEKTQPQPEPVRFKVGEYARTLTDVRKDLPKGSIVKITRDDHDSRPFRSVLLDGSDYDFYRQDELERVDAETAKWATIGRKVNEFKAGDLAVVVDTLGGKTRVGQIVEVFEGDGTDAPSVYVDGGTTYFATVKLVTPVEQRFDRMELTEVEAKVAA